MALTLGHRATAGTADGASRRRSEAQTRQSMGVMAAQLVITLPTC